MKKSWKIRKDLEGVSPVIATILMVAITVVLAAVLYVMVSMIINRDVQDLPRIEFGTVTSGAPDSNNYTASWNVAGIDKTDTRLTDYKVVVMMDNVPLTVVAQPLLPNAIMSFGGTVKVLVRDLGGEGRMTIGDSFLVYGMTPGHGWRLSVLWASDSSEVQSQSWSTL